MEKFNFKPMDPDGQYNIKFNDEEKNKIPENFTEEISTEFDLEKIEDDKNRAAKEIEGKENSQTENYYEGKDDPSWEYHGRFLENKNKKENQIINKEPNKIVGNNSSSKKRRHWRGPIGPFNPYK